MINVLYNTNDCIPGKQTILDFIKKCNECYKAIVSPARMYAVLLDELALLTKITQASKEGGSLNPGNSRRSLK